jgi:hypothetical protein
VADRFVADGLVANRFAADGLLISHPQFATTRTAKYHPVNPTSSIIEPVADRQRFIIDSPCLEYNNLPSFPHY